ncbi:MAG: diguanylate cyclase [Chloroflexaceae bacterium]
MSNESFSHTLSEAEYADLQQRIAVLERQLQAQTAECHFFKALVEQSRDGIAVLDQQGAISYANATFAGRAVSDTPDFTAGVRAVLNNEQDCFSLEYSCGNQDDEHWFSGQVTRLTVAGEVYALLRQTEITAQKQSAGAMHESQALLQSIIDHVPAAIFVKSLEGRILLVNQLLANLFNLAVVDMVGRLTQEIFPPELVAAWHAEDQHILATGEVLSVEESNTPDDGARTYLITKFPIPDSSGTIFATGGIALDITERKQAEVALHQRVRELDALRATMNELSRELDLETLLHSIVARAVDLLDATNGELALFDPDQQLLRVQVSYRMDRDYTGTRLRIGEGVMGHAAATQQPLVLANYQEWSDALSLYANMPPQAVVAVPLSTGNQLVGAISIGTADIGRTFTPTDIELLQLFAQQATIAIQNARLFTEVQQLTTIDPLTGLHNRRYFFKVAQHEFERTRRYNQDLAIIMLDIDHFKRINDAYGHAVGDQVLRNVAQRCITLLRTTDIVGRYGGEEMVILLPNTGLDGAWQAAERLRTTLAQTEIPTSGRSLSITASFGVAACPPAQPTELATLIECADQALRAAKQRGKNLVVNWEAGLTLVETVTPTRRPSPSHQHSQALVRVASRVNSHLDLDTVLTTICQESANVLQVPIAVIQLYDPAPNHLSFVAAAGIPPGIAGQFIPTPRPTLDHLIERYGPIVVIPDVREYPQRINEPIHQRLDLRTLVIIPMWHGQALVGALNIATRGRERTFTAEELTLLQGLADQAAVAITNAQLYTDLVQAYDATLAGWSRALELRDQETEGHSRRVTALTVRLVDALGIDPADHDHIRRGALLHDIGKMGVPDTVLLKPGPLTAAEWELMRQHPVYAYELLAPIAFLAPALDIPYYHHERWDGSGYPYGLKASATPLAARIFAVVDVWDALCSDRPYRAAWSRAMARAYLREQAGILFDPDIVAIFLQLPEIIE